MNRADLLQTLSNPSLLHDFPPQPNLPSWLPERLSMKVPTQRWNLLFLNWKGWNLLLKLLQTVHIVFQLSPPSPGRSPITWDSEGGKPFFLSPPHHAPTDSLPAWPSLCLPLPQSATSHYSLFMALSVGRPLSSLYHVSIGIALVAVIPYKINHLKSLPRNKGDVKLLCLLCRLSYHNGTTYLQWGLVSQPLWSVIICNFKYRTSSNHHFLSGRGGWLTGCFICRCVPKHRVGIQQEESALVINLRTADLECLNFIWFVYHIHQSLVNCTQYAELIANTRSWRQTNGYSTKAHSLGNLNLGE